MTSEKNEHEEIWRRIKNSNALFEIYTYFPTLHDAEIKGIDVNFEKREFSLTVDYCDFIKARGEKITTGFTIRWRNVQNANLNWYAEDLYGVKFSKKNNFIKTKFEIYPFGFDGEIISSEMEITNVEIKDDDHPIKEGTIKLSLK